MSAKSHNQTFTPAQSRAVVAATQAFAMRSRTDLKPETKRANVSDVTPRGNITSTSENWPRRLTARSSAAASSRRVVTRSPTPPIGAAISAANHRDR